MVFYTENRKKTKKRKESKKAFDVKIKKETLALLLLQIFTLLQGMFLRCIGIVS